ncbi:2437_t:CDS:2, partial [Entrophospora sp. SA101]
MSNTDDFPTLKEIKKLNVEKLVEFLRSQKDLHLEEDELNIILQKKVTGCAFITLTESKLENWGIQSGSALAIVDFAKMMSISIAIASYFNRENIDKWSHFDCLKYLAKVCANFTSEDRDEIIDMYKNQLRSINSCETRLKKARSKAYKLAENVERSFQREEVTSFFERLDTQ